MCSNDELLREIKEACIGLLSRREHSQLELLNKLALKGFERSVTQQVVDVLMTDGWQSDERFAEAYTRYRIRKGFGPVKIISELRQKGITNFDLEAVVLDLSEGWIDLLEQLYYKKYGDNKSLTQKEYLKRMRFLQQRGFSSEMIQKMIRM